ncbi:hypothetical protein [Tychonema sp. BBK16]|uniref:hypothetical protein n=1 Tax=Tychonema sp. BBK16 TaxID=2699888 RepID=UPI001F2338F2|nr:hypothetical protein [Tychonema sp. BBK16]MCF6374160.1 hypothetical protein [Tychonema sp. BBK16]
MDIKNFLQDTSFPLTAFYSEVRVLPHSSKNSSLLVKYVNGHEVSIALQSGSKPIDRFLV